MKKKNVPYVLMGVGLGAMIVSISSMATYKTDVPLLSEQAKPALRVMLIGGAVSTLIGLWKLKI